MRVWNNLHQVRYWNNLHQVRYWNNLHQVRMLPNRKIGKPKFQSFGSNKTKGPKQELQKSAKLTYAYYQRIEMLLIVIQVLI